MPRWSRLRCLGISRDRGPGPESRIHTRESGPEPQAESVLPNLDVLPQDTRARLAAEHVAVAIDGHELGPAPCLHVRVPSLVENEVIHPAGFRVPDPDPLLPAWIVHEVRLGVGHVNLILVIEEDSAR